MDYNILANHTSYAGPDRDQLGRFVALSIWLRQPEGEDWTAFSALAHSSEDAKNPITGSLQDAFENLPVGCRVVTPLGVFEKTLTSDFGVSSIAWEKLDQSAIPPRDLLPKLRVRL